MLDPIRRKEKPDFNKTMKAIGLMILILFAIGAAAGALVVGYNFMIAAGGLFGV